MLPEFPWFKPIELTDRPAIEAATAEHPPFADFNFVELWCWNRGEQGGIANLDGNLVVRWVDCVTGAIFLSFIGANRVGRTASRLIAYAQEHGIDARLKAVPDVVIEQGGQLPGHLLVEEDVDNWDYVLSTEEWATLQGSKYKNKRNVVNRLERDYAPEFSLLDATDPAVRAEMLALCHRWAEQRQRTDDDTDAEFQAITNLLELVEATRLERILIAGARIGGELVGFSVNEALPGGYALGHFAKADYRYQGIYPFLLRGISRELVARGVTMINIEADLGDPGLAEAKKLNNPVGRLKKYSIADAIAAGRQPVPAAWEREAMLA